MAVALSLSAPITTRSGRMKSLIADPSRRNSGFEATWMSRSGRALATISLTRLPVPTGTVDLVTSTVGRISARATSSAAAKTKDRSACPSPRRLGVPTAMNPASAPSTAAFRSVLKLRRPARTFFSTRSSKPGSYIGIWPCDRRSILPASLSTQTVRTPNSEKQVPDTRPT